jgi:hypothetical protein
MNTTSLIKPAGLFLGLLFAALASNSAVATVVPTKADANPAKLCAGAEVVASTIMQPMMANGKGPMVPAQIGTKTVCHMCPVATLVTRNSMANGKGTPVTTEVIKVGPEHNCTKCTGTPAKT